MITRQPEKYYASVDPAQQLNTTTTHAEHQTSDGSRVETVDNRIYFYDDIEEKPVLKLVKELRQIEINLARIQAELGPSDPIPIYLHIHSYGGVATLGMAAMDAILNCPQPVVTIVDGYCASGATFLAVAGKKRLIRRHAFMLIHQLRAVAWGKYDEIKERMQNLELVHEMIKRIYREHTKVPSSKLEALLKRDLIFSPEQCVEYGLVDEIIG